MTQPAAAQDPAVAPIRERLAWRPEADEHEAIRRLWINHSKAEDARDLDGLMATLVDDCVYHDFVSGKKWYRHEGARRFYTELLTAYPDIHFDLFDIVIGPQGVFEVADVQGTFTAEWLGIPPTGAFREWRVVIHFPWDRERRLFLGENIYAATPDAPAQ